MKVTSVHDPASDGRDIEGDLDRDNYEDRADTDAHRVRRGICADVVSAIHTGPLPKEHPDQAHSEPRQQRRVEQDDSVLVRTEQDATQHCGSRRPGNPQFSSEPAEEAQGDLTPQTCRVPQVRH